ncbi:MAG: hypothetical protein LBG15_10735 [Dysgonamonadaceae bacterium]|jgi:hypothetical protein|nr:hypothetical protein [Dysgonamonadaceae bacterium]
MAKVTTEGWDLVAVAKQSILNDQLVKAYNKDIFPHQANVSVMEMSFNGILGIPVSDLNPASTQGTNSIASIIVPITGTVTVHGKQYTLPENSTLGITSNLKYVKIQINEGEAMQLYLDLCSKMAVYSVTIQPSEDWVALLNGMIQYYFQNNFTGGSYYLGSVNLQGVTKELLPVNNISFATQPSKIDKSANILAMTANTFAGSGGNLDFTNDPPLLPSTQNVALYISNRCLLYNLVLPVLVKQLNTDNASFTVTGGTATPYTLSLNRHISISGKYDPSLTSLKVYVNDSHEIQGDYGATGYPLSGLDSIIWVEIIGKFDLTPQLSNVEQKISFSVNAPHGSGSIHLSVGGWFIVGALIIATFGSLGAVAGAVVAIVIPVVITQLNLDVNMSSIADNIDTAKASFNWPAQKFCLINSIELPGDFILYLTLKD